MLVRSLLPMLLLLTMLHPALTSFGCGRDCPGSLLGSIICCVFSGRCCLGPVAVGRRRRDLSSRDDPDFSRGRERLVDTSWPTRTD